MPRPSPVANPAGGAIGMRVPSASHMAALELTDPTASPASLTPLAKPNVSPAASGRYVGCVGSARLQRAGTLKSPRPTWPATYAGLPLLIPTAQPVPPPSVTGNPDTTAYG